MSRWSRAPREPMPPAPGMILPGVPLAPITGSTQVQERGSDPLADPDRELALQQAKATQPLPVRIVVPSQADASTEISDSLQGVREVDADVSSPAPPVAEATSAWPEDGDGAVDDSAAGTANEPTAPLAEPSALRDAVADHAGPQLQPQPQPQPQNAERPPAVRAALPRPVLKVPAPRTGSDVFARGPWPDPAGPAWPRTIPPWGAPPRGFAPVESRVGVVMKDGSRVEPSEDQARQMLGLVASLGG